MTNEIKVKPMKARNKRREKQQNKKNQAIVNETLKTAQLEHTKESLISMEKPSVSDDEIVTVEEMSCFYVDPITGEIQTISFEQDVSFCPCTNKFRYLIFLFLLRNYYMKRN